MEGNTKLDLVFGSIRKRKGTELGIGFDKENKKPSVCFEDVIENFDLCR